jgi:ATP-binding cassette subfamily G (WHITE) protein 2
VLILDEPTTELEKPASDKIVRCLKTYATKENAVVIANMHEPSPTMFYQFDSLLLLTDGQPVFQGPALEAKTYFASLGLECPDD